MRQKIRFWTTALLKKPVLEYFESVGLLDPQEI